MTTKRSPAPGTWHGVQLNSSLTHFNENGTLHLLRADLPHKLSDLAKKMSGQGVKASVAQLKKTSHRTTVLVLYEKVATVKPHLRKAQIKQNLEYSQTNGKFSKVLSDVIKMSFFVHQTRHCVGKTPTRAHQHIHNISRVKHGDGSIVV